MFISGSFKELQAILERAIITNALHMNFLEPNLVLIVHGTGDEYTFIKSSLFVSNPIVLSRVSIRNLLNFIRNSWRRRKQITTSPYHQIKGDTIEIEDNRITFDNDAEFSFEVPVNFSYNDIYSPVHEKMDHLSLSALATDYPFLRIKPEVFQLLTKGIKCSTKSQLVKENHVNLNRLYVNKEGNLTFERAETKDIQTYKDEDEYGLSFGVNYSVRNEFDQTVFYLLDLDIRMLKHMVDTQPIDNIYLIPYYDFYIIETHSEEELLSKIHMKYHCRKMTSF